MYEIHSEHGLPTFKPTNADGHSFQYIEFDDEEAVQEHIPLKRRILKAAASTVKSLPKSTIFTIIEGWLFPTASNHSAANQTFGNGTSGNHSLANHTKHNSTTHGPSSGTYNATQ